MRLTTTLLTLLFVQLPFIAIASDYFDEFKRLKKSGNDTEIQKYLSEADATEKVNPDYYATAGNYWWQLSQSVSITTKPSEDDDVSVQDQESEKEVGSISTVGRTNPDIPKKALDILSEGARRFPLRVDISLGLAHIQREMGLQTECVDTLLSLLAVSKTDSATLKWTRDGDLPSAPNDFVPEAVQGYSASLYRAETAEADVLCSKLCAATIAAFPDHPFAYNIKAALATAHGKQDEALRYLETASSKAPNDPLILLNLGDTYLKDSQHDKAKKTYARILKIKGIDDSLKQQARDAIQDVESGRRGVLTPAPHTTGHTGP